MIVPFLRRLRADRRGAATIEFAIWGSMFFMGMLGALDFGMWRTYQLRLASAVEQGAMAAFTARTTLDQTAATSIGTYVTAAAALPAPGAVTTAVGCNGGTNNCVVPASRTCACLSTAANGANSFAAATCGTTCTGGSTAGYYMTIRASYPYKAVVLPQAWLNAKTMAERVTVRLQ